MNALSPLDLAMVLLYLLGMLFIGFYFKKDIKSPTDYYIAGRSLGAFVLMATVCASILGGSAMVGRGGVMYSQGMVGLVLGVPYLVGMYVFTLMSGRIQKMGERNGIVSIPDLMNYRFGGKVRLLVAALVAFSMMATVASQIAAFATIITMVGGISYEVAAWIALGVIVAYTSISGLYGVVYTDVAQFIILILFVYIMLPIRSLFAVGGISGLISQLPAEHLKLQFTPEILGWIFTNLIFTFAGAEMWQRAFASKSPKTATKGMFWGNTTYLYTLVITSLLGLCAVVLLPNLVQDYGTADAAIPALTISLLPTGLLGLAVAGLIAVIMSSADTYLLISVQTVVRDIIKPLCKKEMDGKTELRVSRLFSILLGIGALVISLYVQGIYRMLMFAWTFYAASVGIPAVAALYWKKATAWGIGAGVLSGFVTSVTWGFLNAPFGISASMIGSIVCAIFTVGVSLATYKSNPAPMPEL